MAFIIYKVVRFDNKIYTYILKMEGKSIGAAKKQRDFAMQQNPRKSITNSLKTPALLFYKPTQNTNKKSKEEPNHFQASNTQKYQHVSDA